MELTNTPSTCLWVLRISLANDFKTVIFRNGLLFHKMNVNVKEHVE